MATVWKKIYDKFLEFLCPNCTRCLLCGSDIKEGEFCSYCQKEFYLNEGRKCVLCSRPTVSVDDIVCEQCKNRVNVFEQAFAPIVYKGTGLALIRRFKYHARRDLGEFLVRNMLKEYAKIPETDIIIPVPMWQGKHKDRLYSSADELAQLLSEKTKEKVVDNAVIKVRDTGTQTKLSREKREANVKDCFRVIDKTAIKGKRILIVDDVYTTGATANELSIVLKKAKAKEIYVLVGAIAV